MCFFILVYVFNFIMHLLLIFICCWLRFNNLLTEPVFLVWLFRLRDVFVWCDVLNNKKITVLIPTSLSIKQNEVDNQPLIGKQGLQCVSVNDSKAYNDICAMAVDSREYFINIQLDLMDMARKKIESERTRIRGRWYRLSNNSWACDYWSTVYFQAHKLYYKWLMIWKLQIDVYVIDVCFVSCKWISSWSDPFFLRYTRDHYCRFDCLLYVGKWMEEGAKQTKIKQLSIHLKSFSLNPSIDFKCFPLFELAFISTFDFDSF